MRERRGGKRETEDISVEGTGSTGAGPGGLSIPDARELKVSTRFKYSHHPPQSSSIIHLKNAGVSFSYNEGDADGRERSRGGRGEGVDFYLDINFPGLNSREKSAIHCS